MNYKDTVAQATIALYSAAFIKYGGQVFRDPEILSSTIKEAEKLADELRITARLDPIEKNEDPVQFKKKKNLPPKKIQPILPYRKQKHTLTFIGCKVGVNHQ